MSLRKPLTVFALSCAFTISAVAYVHWAQENDIAVSIVYDFASHLFNILYKTMKQNVLRDIAKEELAATKIGGLKNEDISEQTGARAPKR